jgi:hypothetical protein
VQIVTLATDSVIPATMVDLFVMIYWTAVTFLRCHSIILI